MSGNCYGVLFDNGVFKVGRSRSVVSRVGEHIKSAESLGLGVSLIFITESVVDEMALEAKILGLLSNKINTRGVEYFEGVSRSQALSIFTATGVMFYPLAAISNIKHGRLNCAIPMDLILSDLEIGIHSDLELIKVKNKIFDSLESGTLPTGKINNRLRSTPKALVLAALSEMEAEGSIYKSTHKHPKMKRDVNNWTLSFSRAGI